MTEGLMAFKRAVRKFIPDRIMARYRLHQHSSRSRVNVDIIVGTEAEQRSWLATTPDTYRVGRAEPVGPAPADEITRLGDHGDEAARLLATWGGDIGIVGRVDKPALVASRRSEPGIDPTGVAIEAAALERIGGAEIADHPIGVVVDLARAAGLHLVIQPTSDPPADTPQRGDVIDRPVAVVLSGVPMDDIGGGSRAAQVALQLVTEGFHVVYVELFGTQESVDLGVRFVSPHLELRRWDRFDTATLIARASVGGMCIVEMPAPQYLDPFMALRDAGWATVYDIIDAWGDTALGGEWYSERIERQFITNASAVVASAPDLIEHAGRSGSDAVLVANGVNTRLFGAGGPIAEPLEDLGRPVFGYHGSLYGSWFDWDVLDDVAAAFPEGSVVVIGDAKAPHPPMRPNVHFLGLLPQQELPAWIRGFDVGIVPFVVSDTTHAVSPLKVYECLACGVPVAAPRLRALTGLEGVITADTVVDAARSALGTRVDAVAASERHGWANRIATLLAAAGVERPTQDGVTPTTLIRPVTHYGRRERRLPPPGASLAP